jgi:predicted RNA-binding protein with PIN domain
MPCVIDGNNVMAQIVGWHRDKGLARRNLIHDLVCFVKVNRVKVTVVFDGAEDADFPDGRLFKGVRILYANPGSDADSRIKDIVSRSSHKRDLIVVTSDRPLGSFVAGHGTRVVSSGKFRRMLEESFSVTTRAEKKGETGPVDVDDWMSFFETETK